MDSPKQPACVDPDIDPDMFFPERNTPDYYILVRSAKFICESCDLRIECLESVVDNPEIQGIWGGTTARQRQTLRGRKRKSRNKAA